MALKYPNIPGLIYPIGESQAERTLISAFENRAEQRRSKWSQGYHLFSLKYKSLRNNFLRAWEFYQLCRGAKKEFNFKNPYDLYDPLETIDAYWLLHEGEGTKIDDLHGFINPIYKCRFSEDNLSFEQFNFRFLESGLKLFQTQPIIFTNNYGTLSGGASWAECPDGSACVDFDGADGQASMGDPAALDIGTGDFSCAFGIYAKSLSSQVCVQSKKATDLSSAKGYHFVIGTNGQITMRLADGTNQNVIQSAAGAIPSQTWKIVMATINRSGAGQLYVNNTASGSPVTITATANADNSNNFYLGRTEGLGYGNCRMRNFLFAKKVLTQTERDKIWNVWRGILGI